MAVTLTNEQLDKALDLAIEAGQEETTETLLQERAKRIQESTRETWADPHDIITVPVTKAMAFWLHEIIDGVATNQDIEWFVEETEYLRTRVKTHRLVWEAVISHIDPEAIVEIALLNSNAETDQQANFVEAGARAMASGLERRINTALKAS